MYYVGIDVHQRRSSVEILDQNGALYKRFEVRGPWTEVIGKIEKETPRPYAVAYEASCGYGYLHDALARRAARVEVAHPGKVRLIFNSKHKFDRIDAAKLGKLLFLGAIPQVHVPSAAVRAGRALVEFRQQLVTRKVGAKNRIKALLRGLGIESPIKRLWTQAGIIWLKALALDPLDGFRRDVLVAELRRYHREIRRVDKKLMAMMDQDSRVDLLRTIPGVGFHTAAAFIIYIDQIERFSNVRQVGNYFGIVPRQDTSAGKTRLGHITKDGPATVRKLVCEASWMAIRKSPSLRQRYERIIKHSADRKKIAITAIGHHLLRVMAAMLRTGEMWRETPATS